jgi:hypothetical protein
MEEEEIEGGGEGHFCWSGLFIHSSLHSTAAMPHQRHLEPTAGRQLGPGSSSNNHTYKYPYTQYKTLENP